MERLAADQEVAGSSPAGDARCSDHGRKDGRMGEIRVIDPSGDTKIVWDAGRADEVAAARKTFDDLTGKGYLAFSVKKKGDKGKKVDKFDPNAEKLILTPPSVGG